MGRPGSAGTLPMIPPNLFIAINLFIPIHRINPTHSPNSPNPI
jgi:hypothetical protein